MQVEIMRDLKLFDNSFEEMSIETIPCGCTFFVITNLGSTLQPITWTEELMSCEEPTCTDQ